MLKNLTDTTTHLAAVLALNTIWGDLKIPVAPVKKINKKVRRQSPTNPATMPVSSPASASSLYNENYVRDNKPFNADCTPPASRAGTPYAFRFGNEDLGDVESYEHSFHSSDSQ